MKYTIEIATNDYTTVAAAVSGGADRIELCSALSEGGLTPSFGLIKKCKQDFSVPIFPIIRPRSGDFLYTEEEFRIMLDDVLLCKDLGCEGVVIGFLLEDGSVDTVRLEKAVAAAYPMEVTFHRAFDRCVDPFKALEDIIDAGCQRILTSGQELVAPDGAELIRRLVEAADGRIIILPGSGVRKENIKSLAEQTGAVEFHSSLRSTVKSSMQFQHPSFVPTADDFVVPAIQENEVAALKTALAAVSIA
ncbi:copper homeostasis protein CutC [Paracnuella aquatica]|uniref:copper homeostasis protein CutC n=1 Tax=Paracnuella aquatica TaxID=2268757 RepID=UPI000DEF64FC|nr:copper homeostasis protein CutC [Paracnuella aquatica]RPD45567.1 copper homeostasis protein CutC [Paracnuella aquatica]